jgi:hypothetical protein
VTEAEKALLFTAREKSEFVGRFRLRDVRLELLPRSTEDLSPLLERRKGRIGTEKGRWGGWRGKERSSRRKVNKSDSTADAS